MGIEPEFEGLNEAGMPPPCGRLSLVMIRLASSTVNFSQALESRSIAASSPKASSTARNQRPSWPAS